MIKAKNLNLRVIANRRLVLPDDFKGLHNQCSHPYFPLGSSSGKDKKPSINFSSFWMHFFFIFPLSPPFSHPKHSSLWLKDHPPDTVNLVPVCEQWDGGVPPPSRCLMSIPQQVHMHHEPFPTHHPNPFRWAPVGEVPTTGVHTTGSREFPWMGTCDFLTISILKPKE